MKTVTKHIQASSLIAILTITLFGVYALNRYHAYEISEENNRREVCIKTFWHLLADKGSNYRVVDGNLLVGNYLVNGNFEVPDKVKDIFGGVATIFMGDERVSTNVLNAEGKRALGTRLVGPAYDAVFKQGKAFRGEATILGVPYLTAYDPIKDRTGKIIGALFVGGKKNESLARLSELKMHLTLTLSGVVTFFTIFMIMLGRAVKRVEKVNGNQISFQQTMINTIPSPIFYKDATCRYLGCNTAFEEYVGCSQNELIGKTAHELWPEELADLFRQQDLALLGKPGIHVYETTVRYADGTLHDVIFKKATFNESDGTVGGLVGVVLDITERKRTEEAEAFQNILLSTQQEASIDGILVVDGNGKILSFNRRFVEIMDIPSQVLETREDEVILKYAIERMLDPQNFQEKIKYLYEHRQESSRDEISMCDGKTLDRYTVPLLGSDGRYFGRLWSFRDITERKAEEIRTKYAYQQLHDIVEFLPDATFVVDKEKRVIAWNRAIEKMTGLKKEEVIGKGDYIYALPLYGERRPILIDLIDDDIDAVRHKYAHIYTEGRTLFAEAFAPSLNNGNGCYLWGTATPLYDGQGNQVGAIETVRDITEYKRSAEEKSRLEARLHHAQMMETLMARLGHDLKTPLTPLFILLPIIKNRITEPDLIRKVDMCINSSAAINNLADKTSVLASLSAMAKPNDKKCVSLASIVDHSVAECADRISKKQINCKNAVNPTEVVDVVPEQFHMLFNNLISNAAYFSPEKGVIVISAERHAETLMILVQDEGVGIDPAHLNHVFDEFFKVDESRHDINSTGLGLPICKRIVQNHNGRIWAESPGVGMGTTIKFTI